MSDIDGYLRRIGELDLENARLRRELAEMKIRELNASSGPLGIGFHIDPDGRIVMTIAASQFVMSP